MAGPMRTADEAQKLYQGISVQEAARRLGGDEPLSDEQVLGLGEDGELEVWDCRRRGARRAVWRVDPESVDAFRKRRRLKRSA